MPRRSRERSIEAVPRRLLTGAEASLGMSIAHFERFVQPFIKVLQCGQMLLIERIARPLGAGARTNASAVA